MEEDRRSEGIRSLYSTRSPPDMRDSAAIKDSWEAWQAHRLSPRKSSVGYDEYLVAMKRAHSDSMQMPTPRARRRARRSSVVVGGNKFSLGANSVKDYLHITTIASMVPDEIIYNHAEHSMRSYETALMFIDVSGFTNICEAYTKLGRDGGPSKLTQVLNSYIGAMVQEILTHNGDVLKFAGDAFLSMWKKTPRLTMQDIVHSAIDCGLVIQKNYGTYTTDLGITLKVKVAISAGVSHFAIIGGAAMSSFVVVGQPVWDVKAAEYASAAGDVLATASAWAFVNEADYCAQPAGDGRHTHILGVGVTWKRVENFNFEINSVKEDFNQEYQNPQLNESRLKVTTTKKDPLKDSENARYYREYSLRPAVITALKSAWWPALRRFMVTPVLRAVDNDEPLEFLTEVRHVVVVFLNVITRPLSPEALVEVVDRAYKQVYQITSEAGGLVNKVSMFDKDMMFLVVFGLRGLKHEAEAQMAVLCAHRLKQLLQEPAFTSVSIGVTSGRTYCGVVGHMLRREYTVIGSSVNKAARLMVAYQNKVTCDKETFVRSKLDLDFFRLMETKHLKGINNPGLIYEFNQSGWPERKQYVRHPILGRNEEIRRFKEVLQNAIDHQHENFTRYRDFRYGIIILGPKLVGKKRLVDEFLSITPAKLRPVKINMVQSDLEPFSFTRKLMQSLSGVPAGKLTSLNSARQTYENRVRVSLGRMRLTPLQVYAVNTMFDVHFPLPDKFHFKGDLLNEPSVKELLVDMFTNRFRHLRVLGVKDGQYIDDMSWRCLLRILDSKSIFVVIAIDNHESLSPTAKMCLTNHMFVKLHLQGIDRWYHGALACQLLDVQAIPADLEKVMESASGGLPGWIQNLVISLMQRGELAVVTVPRLEAVEAGAVMPCSALLQRPTAHDTHIEVLSVNSKSNFSTASPTPSKDSMTTDAENIQMAVLLKDYNFDDMKVDMTMDVIILKTYDSLTPFEKMLLKCGSVLGDVFSRAMLLHLLQSDCPRKVALAVAKLFEIRVLECEGGDFSGARSAVLIRPAPPPLPSLAPPACACIGTAVPPNCRDLPMYAFCGYMKFKHSLFRTTTYELLTEEQKLELHQRALLYLERYTRRCSSCGCGCFITLFGVRSNDGLVYESKQLKRVRRQISALAAEARTKDANLCSDRDDFLMSIERRRTTISFEEEMMNNKSNSDPVIQRAKLVRSFTSMNLDKCECLLILLSVYDQAIGHFDAVGDCDKLFETFMEFVDVSLINLNMPQVIRLLQECEAYFNHCCNSDDKRCVSELCAIPWIDKYRTGRVAVARGKCMLESGEYEEARVHLLKALQIFGCPFPRRRWAVRAAAAGAALRQLAARGGRRRRRAGSPGWRAAYFDHVAEAHAVLYKLFVVCKEKENASLAAKRALYFVTKSNCNFRLLCIAYANMITVYRKQQQFAKCAKLEKLALDICNRKTGKLDVTEVYAVSTLYTSFFLLHVEGGTKLDSLEIGMSVLPLLPRLPDAAVAQSLVIGMLQFLLRDLRVAEMVMVMREFCYMTDHYDLSAETWYYYFSMVVLLDTGYCVEHYNACEKFYIRKGDAILRSKTPEAAYNFFVAMWLVTVRCGAWERSVLWEEKIHHIMSMNFKYSEYMVTFILTFIEGNIISYVNEVNNRNVKKAELLKQRVNNLFCNYVDGIIKEFPLHQARYLFLYAHYQFLQGHKKRAEKKLKRSLKIAKKYGLKPLKTWIAHTEEHWKGLLDESVIDYWVDHVEVDTALDYRLYQDDGVIVPYTLPLFNGNYN